MNKSVESSCLWIIEDDFEIRSLLAYFGRDEGFTVTEISSLAEAQVVYDKSLFSGRVPMAILSDYNLKDGNAEKFLIQCRLKFPAISIICMSATADASVPGRLKGFDIPLMRKPIALGELLALLHGAVT